MEFNPQWILLSASLQVSKLAGQEKLDDMLGKIVVADEVPLNILLEGIIDCELFGS